MAGSAALSSDNSFDRRSQEPHTKPVWKAQIIYTIDAGDGSTEITSSLPKYGLAQMITAESGTAAGIVGTFTLAIDNDDDIEVFSQSGPAEGAASVWDVNIPLCGTTDIRVNPSDDPTSGSWTITVTLWGI